MNPLAVYSILNSLKLRGRAGEIYLGNLGVYDDLKD